MNINTRLGKSDPSNDDDFNTFFAQHFFVLKFQKCYSELSLFIGCGLEKIQAFAA